MDHLQPLNTPEASPDHTPDTAGGDADIDQAPSEEEKKARSDYLKSLSSPKKSRKLLIATGLLIVIAALCLAGYFLILHKSKPAPKPVTINKLMPSPQPKSTTLQNYVSKGTDLNLSFDYPSNWKVSPPSGGNTDDQTISLTSPLTSITSADGKSVIGKVEVRIRPASAGLNELSSGNSTVASPSVQFAYSKPTTDQYQYPYLIFIHLAGGSNPNSQFEEVLVSGTTQFAKGQSIMSSSLSVDPIITANIYMCAATSCNDSVVSPLGVTAASWQSASIFQQTLAIFESLQIN